MPWKGLSCPQPDPGFSLKGSGRVTGGCVSWCLGLSCFALFLGVLIAFFLSGAYLVGFFFFPLFIFSSLFSFPEEGIGGGDRVAD